VGCAGRWLEECSIDVGEVVNFKDFPCWVGTEFGKTTIYTLLARLLGDRGKIVLTHSHTVSLEVLAEEKLTASAVETLIAELRIAVIN
jgi:hypothetical protein